MMKQLLLADYQKNPTKYDKEGVVNYNIGQIHYQKTTDEMILWIYLKSRFYENKRFTECFDIFFR